MRTGKPGRDGFEPPEEWVGVIAGRPLAEQALIRAVLAAHEMLGFEAWAPSEGSRQTASEFLASVRSPERAREVGRLMAAGFGERREAADLGSEVLLDALYRYLVVAMGTGDPRNQSLAGEALALSIAAAPKNPWYRPMVAVAVLLAVEHIAEAGDLDFARYGVDKAMELLSTLRHEREYRGTASTALAVARAAQAELKRAASQ